MVRKNSGEFVERLSAMADAIENIHAVVRIWPLEAARTS